MHKEEDILRENNLYFHPFQLRFQWAFFGIRMEGTYVEGSFCFSGEFLQSLNH